MNMTWKDPGFSATTVSTGLDDEAGLQLAHRHDAAVDGHLVDLDTLLEIAAGAADQRVGRRVPVLVMVIKPPATFEAGGGTRVHTSVILSAPAA
ncbi:MAG: hypothetical protein V9E89_19125 [Ilumatobacteraceae bacterium]